MDVSVWDDTIMAPSTPFTKIWRMQNNGSIPWPQGARLVWTGGDKFSDSVVAEIKVPADGVPVSEVLDIAVDFTAPVVPGQYISYWRMESPTCVKFGPQVWVLIQVDNSLNESLCEGFEGLNLNLPPTNDDFGAPKSIDVSVKPEVDDAFVLGTRIANTGTTELVKPMAVEQPKRDQQLNFTINDSMLVGNAISASSPASSSVPYPVIDLPDATPSSEVEQSLLKELEEMGFKQVDLNKEILRMNEYDLQRSLDDLCGDAEWDPILEELMAMGFNDAETNKRLLKKNNGSIKGVVMDLFAQEKP
jgi:next-to-BRCA1 protein 1